MGELTRISRNPAVLLAKVDAEVVMMSVEQGQYFGLDDIGTDVWQRIEAPCSFAELVDALHRDYEADRATIAADLGALLRQMAEYGVVRLD